MRLRPLAVVSTAALTLATFGTVTLASGAATASDTTVVQVPERLCAAPAAGHARCLAIRLKDKRVSTTRAATMRADGRARPAKLKRLADGPAGGYTPAQLAKAYGVNPAAATSQTVAIVDAYNDPSVRDDLNTFDTKYGLPHETGTSLKVVGQTGSSTSLPADDTTGWAGEITLDVQAVRGLCHHCKILLVEANSDNDPDLAAAENYAAAHASIVSNSFGEAEIGSSRTYDAAYNHPGVAILASTGDDGWYDWDNVNPDFTDPAPATIATSSNSPSVPASQPSVIGVGGTTLSLNPDGSRAAERVWNDNGPNDDYGYYEAYSYGAAGSGCSTLFSAKPWQSKVSGYGTLGCGAARSDVDIAADADYYTGLDVYQDYGNDAGSPGWYTIGGTSLASPLVAAMWALAGGPGKVSYPALSLYGHYHSTRGSTYDVRVGGNDICGGQSPTSCLNSWGKVNTLGLGLLSCGFTAADAVVANRYQCNAGPGYDGVSGVGTPNGLTVFKPISPIAKIAVGGKVKHKKSHTFSAKASRSAFPGGKITKYVWSWGDGKKTTTTKPTAKHKYAKKGKRTIKVTVSDSYGAQNNGRTGSVSVKVKVK